VPEAFQRLYRLERACQIQLDAAAAGPLRLLTDNVAKQSAAGVRAFTENKDDGYGFGELEFAALLRKLDKIDPGYRT
jgi:hypothetical protein